ncbi:hypothetical protein CLHUN_11650 [Ruminiclostridium hungatei]|uniref:Uncharacterized protein n=1 Tax=Ruminiclostridium hungatei TaxID=48256 RepID=A0A1V4SMB4_RUMHU|nr:DUF6320 domain-containing protein [Ruminiclostridium hungatei]OPX44933.1 hypothetical protein CLHUN_11650 [Ruminiclostridium hungatei]
MNKCNQCGIYIYGNDNKCPLCNKSVGELKDTYENEWYPAYNISEASTGKGMVKKVYLFIAITVISVCLLVNVLAGLENLWFLYVACPIMYLLLLINHTILSKVHTGMKIILQISSISVLLFTIDILSGFYRWSVNIVIPYLFIAGTLIITVIILRKKMLWKEYAGYIIAMIFLGFLPMLLYLTGVADTLWAAAISALYSFLTVIGMLIFANKRFKNEVTRRFHL